MKKFLGRGLVFLAGVVSVPLAKTPRLPVEQPRVEPRSDPRLKSLRDFFRSRDCPALHYAHAFLTAADKYSLDWRLLPSISFVESTGGKAARNNNLFGWDSGRASFNSPATAIHILAYRLTRAELYRGKELDRKLAIYNPDPAYARKVKSVMRLLAVSE